MNRDQFVHLLETCCSAQNETSTVSGRQAKEKIISFLKKSGTTPDMAGRIWSEPEVFLGKFTELPIQLQKALAEAAAFFDKERILENKPFLRDHILMPLGHMGNMFLSAGERVRKRNKEGKEGLRKFSLSLITKILFNIGTISGKGTFRLAKRIIDFIRFTQWYRQPFFYAFWKYLHTDIQNLCYSYLEGIPVDAASGAVWQCPEKSAESAMLIGLDFVPSGGKLYFIEANFNAGFGRERLLMYEDQEDPIGKNLVSFALEKKYRTIHIYGHNESAYFNAETEQSWRRTAEKNHIHLEVIDDIFSPSLCFSRKKRMVPKLTEQTLNVLVRAPANAVLSELIAEKGNLEDCIRKINPQPDIPALPALSGHISRKDRESDAGENYHHFPKMIIKHRMKDDAQGITILNSYEIPDEYKSVDYLVTEFLKPDLISKSQNEYVYKYRSILLLTADGSRYLGSYILRSGIPVPCDLPEGIVTDMSPFIANYSFGGAYENVSENQDNLCKEASLAVGDVIHSFLKQKTMSDIPVNFSGKGFKK